MHLDGAHVGLRAVEGVFLLLVSDVGEHKGGACRSRLCEVTVDVGYTALCGTFHYDTGSNERFACLGVDQLAAHLDVLRIGCEAAYA